MISTNLKKIRGFKGLSRKELSEMTGLSTVALWKIESGRNDPSVGTLEKLAHALDVDVAIFFADSINFSQQKEGA